MVQGARGGLTVTFFCWNTNRCSNRYSNRYIQIRTSRLKILFLFCAGGRGDGDDERQPAEDHGARGEDGGAGGQGGQAGGGLQAVPDVRRQGEEAEHARALQDEDHPRRSGHLDTRHCHCDNSQLGVIFICRTPYLLNVMSYVSIL